MLRNAHAFSVRLRTLNPVFSGYSSRNFRSFLSTTHRSLQFNFLKTYLDHTKQKTWTATPFQKRLFSQEKEAEGVFLQAQAYFEKREFELGARFMKEAASLGHRNAKFRYANLLRKGIGVTKNPAEAARIYFELSKEKDILASYTFGVMAYKGEGMKQNYKLAIQVFNFCLKNGMAAPLVDLGVMNKNGEGFPKNKEKALEFFQAAVKAEISEGFRRLGEAYETGDLGVEKNLEKAFELYVEAAKRGNAWGLYHVGRCYMLGLGTELNYSKSGLYLQLAASKGHLPSLYEVACMFLEGKILKQNTEEAKKIFLDLSKQTEDPRIVP
eukprot:TRINITY_DN9214_c0_g1_i1.p1 TRINITY_DN9214_c0_g1~~TRINITY_DN9214_c0_g1_i1.p1  ORF type:complete len:326 (-),score=69.45 TRINITY_DN9214_c0_g1_i1:65-1042(-)